MCDIKPRREALTWPLTPEEDLFRATVRDFCVNEIDPDHVRQCNREQKAPRDLYDKTAKR